jgi:hypothetical protein
MTGEEFKETGKESRERREVRVYYIICRSHESTAKLPRLSSQYSNVIFGEKRINGPDFRGETTWYKVARLEGVTAASRLTPHEVLFLGAIIYPPLHFLWAYVGVGVRVGSKLSQ